MASVGDSGYRLIKNCILKGGFLSWDQSQHKVVNFSSRSVFLVLKHDLMMQNNVSSTRSVISPEWWNCIHMNTQFIACL